MEVSKVSFALFVAGGVSLNLWTVIYSLRSVSYLNLYMKASP